MRTINKDKFEENAVFLIFFEKRGITVGGHSRHAGMAFINHWIPACAGMTTKREKVDCQPDNPFAIPDRCLTSAPAFIYGQEALSTARGHAYRDVG